ncbi:hypothetical protein ACQ4PT_050098 [Festuca glaucescens]
MDDEAKMFMRSLMGEFTGNIQGSIDALGVKVDLLTVWKPELELRVAELQTVVGELQRTVLVGQPHVAIDIPVAPATAPVGAGKAAAADLGELRVSETKALCEVHVPPPNALQHFGKMLEDTSTTDVTFKVEGETFAAHRAVLATRSSAFQKQFSEPMKKKTSHITINRMEPTVFKALLHFIYTDSLPKMDDLNRDENNAVLESLLAAADQYDLERLKLMCARILCTNLDVENVAGVLWLADKYNCQKLKEACVDFMDSSDRIDAVVASQGYQLVKRGSPCPLADAWEKRSRARISFR